MLIIRRAEKAETLVNLLQSFYTQLSKRFGVLEKKQGIVSHHAKLNEAMFNVVIGYREPSNVLNIAALLEHVKKLQEPFIWLAYDDNANLAQYLVSQGLDKREPMQGFCYNLSWRMPKYESHPAVKLFEVTTEEQFYEWAHVFALSHGVSFEKVCTYYQSGYGEDRDYILYMAQVYQKTIGCCALYVHENNALMLADTVLPMYRRQGVGSMMALHRMEVAKQLECEGIYAMGMQSYAAMLKDLGFRAFGNYQLFYCEPEGSEDG